MSAFRLCIATTTYKRPELTEAVVMWWYDFPFVGVSPRGLTVGDHLNGIQEPNDKTGMRWHFARAQEAFWRSLSRKHNTMLQLSRGLYDPDAVMVIGSDNLCHPEWIQFCVNELVNGADVVGSNIIHFVDPVSDRVMRSRLRSGAGRCYSRKLLDAYDWKLWPDDLNEGLDGAVDRLLIEQPKYATKQVYTDDGIIVDIKDPEGPNRWTFEEMHSMTGGEILRTPASVWMAETFPTFKMPEYEPERIP